MSITNDVTQLLQTAKKINRTQIAIISSKDEYYAIEICQKSAISSNSPLFYYSSISCKKYVGKSNDEIWENIDTPTDLSKVFGHAQDNCLGGIAIFSEDFWFPHLQDITGNFQMRASLNQIIQHSNKGSLLVFLITPKDEENIPELLRELTFLEIKYPNLNELGDLLRVDIAANIQRWGYHPPVEEIHTLAAKFGKVLLGLTRTTARKRVYDEIAVLYPNVEEMASKLKRSRDKCLQANHSLQVIDVSNTPNLFNNNKLIGQERVWKSLDSFINQACNPSITLLMGLWSSDLMDSAVSLGIATAKATNTTPVKLVLSDMLGNNFSKTRLRETLEILEAMTPVLIIEGFELLMTECTDSSLIYIKKALFSWLSQHKNSFPVIIVAKPIKDTNRIDSSIFTEDWCNKTFFIDSPNLTSRILILQSELNGKVSNPVAAAQQIAELTGKFSTKALQMVIEEAALQAKITQKSFTLDLLQQTIESKRPSIIVLYNEFQALRQWGHRYLEQAGSVDF